MADVASLVVKVSTDGANKAQSELDKLAKQSSKTEKSTKDLSSSFSGLKTALATIGIAEAAKQYVQMADSMKLLEARIKLVSNSSDNYRSIQVDMLKIANENGIAIKSVGDLYTKLSMALKPLGVTTSSVMAVTDAFSKTLLISGASTEEASSATLQFAQAMASGRLQGDEFRSMAENSPRFMKAMTDSLGKTSAELRQMAEDGKLTSSVVGGALIDSMVQIKQEARDMPMTVGKAFNELKNEVTITVEQFDKLAGINDAIAKGFQGITDKVVGLRQELPKLSAEMTKWEKEHEKGLYTLGVVADTIWGGVSSGVKNFYAIERSYVSKNISNALTLTGKIGDAFGIADDQSIKFSESQKKVQAELAKTAKAQKDMAQSIEDEIDAYVAKQQFKNIVIPEAEVKKQLDKALDGYKAYYQAIGDKETILAIKRYELGEKYKDLTKKQLDEYVNGERDKNNKTEELAKKWATRKLEIQEELAVSEEDKIAKPFLKLQLEYQKDLAEFKGIAEAKALLTKNFEAEYQRLGLDTSEKLEKKELERLEKVKRKNDQKIQKELKLQEENFRIQARQVELLDDEADKQVALATLEYQRTQASLKAQMQLGDISPEHYKAMMEMEDKLLEKQKQNWTLAGQVVNNVTSQMESSMTDFLDVTSDNFADFGKMATSILQDVYREIIRISVVRPLVSSLTSGVTSLFSGGVTANATGGAYNSPSLSQYSNQIVDKPTFFAFAQGGAPNLGVMGEGSRSEAIIPLERNSNGDLGVNASGIGTQSVKIQIINESGTQMEVTKTSQSTDVEGVVIQAFISGVSKNRYGVRQLINGG